ncbi:hypothetical protein LJC58_09890 [Lachnospiraceae bacterium OttesenSCG-928-D06]|nr:hypothetical protein [Lachnospiraceae bacterium OttesenSCG-928-D06]
MQTFEDYKYIMQDTYQLYIGTKYSLTEVTENEEIPIKFRVIVERYLYEEAEKDTTLESILYYLEKKSIHYKIFRQLKATIRASVLVEKKSFSGKSKQQYETKSFSLEQLVQMSLEEKEKKGVVIQELIVSKLAMMTF